MGDYQGRLKTVAEFRYKELVVWKTTPDLRLYRNDKEIGKIVQIRDNVPNAYNVMTVDSRNPHKLHDYVLISTPEYRFSQLVSHNDLSGDKVRTILTNPD